MKKVLLGTTNPSKIKRFSGFLEGYDVEICTLADFCIPNEPDETGDTPVENAKIKASFYGRYCDLVICNDSGLYIAELPIDDCRQPGLKVRTPMGMARLSEEEMIGYYASLAHSLGGRVNAYYHDGIAVYNGGRVYAYAEPHEVAQRAAFYLVDDPCPMRHKGWPLDSISINKNTNTYFAEDKNNVYDKKAQTENVIVGDYRARLIAFLVESLGLTKE